MPNIRGRKQSRHSNRSERSRHTSNYIPANEIVNGPAFATVCINLQKGQSIFANAGAMSYMDSNIVVNTSIRGGIFAGFVRGLLTSESAFLTEYKCDTADGNKIALASHLPGDIKPLTLLNNERFILSAFGLICATPNIKLNTQFKWRNIFLGTDPFITEVILDGSDAGMVWLAAYGGYNTIQLAKGEQFTLDHGLFLAAKSDVDYKLGTIGGIKSFFFSGEGIVMKFVGPCVIYTTGRSVTNLVGFIKHCVAPSSERKITLFEG